MDTFAKRLAKAMDDAQMRLTDLSNRTGISKGRISHWLKGDNIPGKNLLVVSNVLGVSPAWLLSGEEPIPFSKPSNKIVILGSVAAGIPITEQPDIIGTVYTEDNTRDLYALRIKGDSMSPRIMDGDLVIVHSQPDADDGELVVARIDGDVTCKVLKKNRHSVSLISFNAAYAPIVLVEGAPLEIIGKVVESRHEW